MLTLPRSVPVCSQFATYCCCCAIDDSQVHASRRLPHAAGCNTRAPQDTRLLVLPAEKRRGDYTGHITSRLGKHLVLYSRSHWTWCHVLQHICLIRLRATPPKPVDCCHGNHGRCYLNSIYGLDGVGIKWERSRRKPQVKTYSGVRI